VCVCVCVCVCVRVWYQVVRRCSIQEPIARRAQIREAFHQRHNTQRLPSQVPRQICKVSAYCINLLAMAVVSHYPRGNVTRTQVFVNVATKQSQCNRLAEIVIVTKSFVPSIHPSIHPSHRAHFIVHFASLDVVHDTYSSNSNNRIGSTMTWTRTQTTATPMAVLVAVQQMYGATLGH
jgi:hypothetical protein